jgi:hypothetical protein
MIVRSHSRAVVILLLLVPSLAYGRASNDDLQKAYGNKALLSSCQRFYQLTYAVGCTEGLGDGRGIEES